MKNLMKNYPATMTLLGGIAIGIGLFVMCVISEIVLM